MKPITSEFPHVVTDSASHKSLAFARLIVWDAEGPAGPTYELIPGHVTTIGRLPLNDIVIDDDLCSRQHCEVFLVGDSWTLRDLSSRNGTFIEDRRVTRDQPLMDRQVIRIGKVSFRFTTELAKSSGRSDMETVMAGENGEPEGDTKNTPAIESDSNILHRTKQSRYSASTLSEQRSKDLARGIRYLYEMATRTAACKDLKELAATVLDGLFDAVQADIGAVLMLPKGGDGSDAPQRFERVAFRNRVDLEYEQVSRTLTRETLAKNEAVLAEDWRSDQPLVRPNSKSLDEMEVRSVICAPIRREGRPCGLIHLYTTRVEVRLGEDDLHLTLAVADHCATVIASLEERASLQRNLHRAERVNLSLREQLEQGSQLVGDSLSLKRLREQSMRIGPTGATVLIRGESGVGKELVARLIQRSSDRRDRALVCMNCAALTESLLESELFGHEKGAFTGATEKKIGKFEQADQGTLFLDEVGEMSLAIQAKFLRVLEGHPFERVGGSRPIQVDVRVVAATNRNLEEAVKAGKFRQDLYFRLHVVQVGIDPLRERRDDIPVLAEHFLKRFSHSTSRSIRGLTTAASELLAAYHWPGNVRELQNTMERAVILCQSDMIDVCDIQLSSLEGGAPTAFHAAGSGTGFYREVTIEAMEQAHILATLEHTEWNKTRAAQILGIERSTLDRKLKRYEVSRPAEP
ncbi:MAG: sigma 54-interacting transcriptional regulator [Planctomycetaceae bacterium]